MGGGTRSRYVKKLVTDTIIWDFSIKDSVAYMKLIGGIDCSESWYSKVKRRVLSDDEIQDWLTEHMKAGFVRAHKLEIEELIRIKKPLLDIYQLETKKEYMIPKLDDDGKPLFDDDGEALKVNNPAYNVDRVIRLAAQIDSLNKSLDDLNSANPMVHAIKQKMNENIKAAGDRSHNENQPSTI